MDRSIFGFILRHSKRQQIVVLLLTLASLPFIYFSLDLPRIIINEAIGGVGFPIALMGYELSQIEYLLALSFLFLALVCINGGFKYYINIYKGLLGERMLRRLRFELYTRMLRFRLPRFKRMSQGEIIPIITSEVEPLGGFIADAYALPLQQGGTLLTYIVFIFIQDPLLGAAALSLYPVQGYLIPRLQRRVNELGKQRVHNIRQIADRVGETVSGAQEIHAHGTARWHMADLSSRLALNFDIRYEIYRRKFFIKFLNNFLNQLTPFFFYSIGGWLVIRGDLSFGALVAVLAAYKDLAPPWKELLTWYQMKEDTRIKYEQVIEQFQPSDLQPLEQLSSEPSPADPAPDAPLPKAWRFVNVGYHEEGAQPALEGLSLSVPTNAHIALLGDAASGREAFAMLLARLLTPTSGRILFGGRDYEEVGEAVVGQRIAYVGPATHLFSGSLRDNLVYGLQRRPAAPPEAEEVSKRQRRRLVEARAAGNSVDDVDADWIDYAAAGVAGPAGLERRMLETLQAVDLDSDVYRMGLTASIDPAEEPEIAAGVMRARAQMRARLDEHGMEALVEPWDSNAYNESASVAENLLFGTPVDGVFQLETLASQPYVLRILEQARLRRTLLAMGVTVAETMIELFADLPPGHEFFEQFSFISSEELPEFPALVARARKLGWEELPEADRTKLMTLPFRLIPARHRLDVIDDAFREKILTARRLFAENLPPALESSVAFFDERSYNAAASIQDNILFGKIRYGLAGSRDGVQTMLAEIIDAEGLRGDVMAVGLGCPVGVAGGRLSAAQRQKLALARSLLKQPDVLILMEALSSLDGATRLRIHDAVREWCAGRGLIWALQQPEAARSFDEILVLKDGRLAERGSFEELANDGGALGRLLTAAE